MSDQQALLRSVIDAPDDDVPRLVYADWLEEHGDHERAEFIRLQIELAGRPHERPEIVSARFIGAWKEKIDEPPPEDGSDDRRQREAELLERNRERWLEEVPGSLRPQAVFRRGFVGEMRATVGQIRRHAAALWARVPLDSLLVTSDTSRAFPGLLRRPELACLRRLNLCNSRIGDGGAEALVACEHLRNLTTLSLNQAALGPAAARALAGSPHLGRLTHLDLGGNHVGPEGAQALAASPFLRSLWWLSISGNMIGVSGAAALAGSPVLGSTERLYLSANGIGDAGAAAVANSPHLGRLKVLNLWRNELTASGVRAVLESDCLAGVARLGLRANPLGLAGAEAIASSPRSARLAALDLSECQIDAEGARLLAASAYLENLEELVLDYRVGEGRQALSERFGSPAASRAPGPVR